jgi:hypothetical protein
MAEKAEREKEDALLERVARDRLEDVREPGKDAEVKP